MFWLIIVNNNNVPLMIDKTHQSWRFLCVQIHHLLIRANLKNTVYSNYVLQFYSSKLCTAKTKQQSFPFIFIWRCDRQTRARLFHTDRPLRRMFHCQRAPPTGRPFGVVFRPKAPDLAGRWNSCDEQTPLSFLHNRAAGSPERDKWRSVNAATAAIKHI